MMGDTRLQESRIKQRVKSELTPPARKQKRSWHVQLVTAAVAAVAVFLFMTAVPFTQNSGNEGRGAPYDPLDDLAEIATLQKRSNYQQSIMIPLHSYQCWNNYRIYSM